MVLDFDEEDSAASRLNKSGVRDRHPVPVADLINIATASITPSATGERTYGTQERRYPVVRGGLSQYMAMAQVRSWHTWST